MRRLRLREVPCHGSYRKEEPGFRPRWLSSPGPLRLSEPQGRTRQCGLVLHSISHCSPAHALVQALLQRTQSQDPLTKVGGGCPVCPFSPSTPGVSPSAREPGPVHLGLSHALRGAEHGMAFPHLVELSPLPLIVWCLPASGPLKAQLPPGLQALLGLLSLGALTAPHQQTPLPHISGDHNESKPCRVPTYPATQLMHSLAQP